MPFLRDSEHPKPSEAESTITYSWNTTYEQQNPPNDTISEIFLLQSTLDRESQSEVKNERLRINIRSGMLTMRPEFVAADTDEKFFYALQKYRTGHVDTVDFEALVGTMIAGMAMRMDDA